MKLQANNLGLCLKKNLTLVLSVNSAKFFRVHFLKNTRGGYFHTESKECKLFDWFNASKSKIKWQSKVKSLNRFLYRFFSLFLFYLCFWQFARNIGLGKFDFYSYLNLLCKTFDGYRNSQLICASDFYVIRIYACANSTIKTPERW